MKRKTCLQIMVVTMLLVASLALIVKENGSNNSDGGGDTPSTYSQLPDSDFLSGGFIPISSVSDLLLIGKGSNISSYDGKTYNWTLSAKYFLTNNIDFTGVDTNGGVSVSISVGISSTTPRTLTITVTSTNNTVSSVYAWADTSSGSNTSGNSTTLSNVSSGTVRITVGGTVTGGSYAYSFDLDTSVSGTYADTFNSNGNFDPIGNNSTGDSSSRFSGTFDGNGYSITGLNVAVFSSTSSPRAGLFGYGNGANISNLGIIDSSIVSISASSTAFAGGIIGNIASSTTISNCYNTGNITGISASSSSYAGGIVGQASSSSTISNCYNTGNITGISSSTPSTYVGGISGYANASTVSNCYNTGDITSITTSNACSAGIVGFTYGSTTSVITNCYNTGAITGIATNVYLGGIIGNIGALSSIYNSYNTGAITGTAGSLNAGGIAGYVSATTSITNCYFLTGTVSGNNIVGYTLAGSLTIDGGATDRGTQASGAKTETQLKTISTYYTGSTSGIAGWNFTDTWARSSNINGGYPILRSLLEISFTRQPTDHYANSLGGTVTFNSSTTVIYTGVTQNIAVQYQWYKSTNNGSTWDPISGATDSWYDLNSITNDISGTFFRVSATVAADNGGITEYSQSAALYVQHAILLTITGTEGYLTYSTDGGETFVDVTENYINVIHGTDVTIKANITTEGYHIEWNGYNETVRDITLENVTDAQSLVGQFVLNTYTVTIVGAGTDGYYTYVLNTVTKGTISDEITDNDVISDVEHGSTLTVTPVPSTGSHFAWSDSETGAKEITVTSNITLTGVFASELYTITVEGAENGCYYTYTINGSQPANVPANGVITNVPEDSEVVIIPVPLDGYSFVWNGYNGGSVTVESDLSFSGTFTLKTYSVEFIGTNLTANPPSSIDHGSTLSLIISPVGGYSLPQTLASVRVGGVALNESQYTYDRTTGVLTILSVNGDVVITADGVFNVSLSPSSHANGKIYYSVNGVENELTSTVWIPTGTSVTIRAEPEQGLVFSYWTGDISGNTNPYTFVIGDNLSVGSVFVSVSSYTLTSGTTDGGEIQWSLDGTAWNDLSTPLTLPVGTSLHIRAIPDNGMMFSSWSGDASGSSDTYVIVINSNMTISATFVHSTGLSQLDDIIGDDGGSLPILIIVAVAVAIGVGVGVSVFILRSRGKKAG